MQTCWHSLGRNACTFPDNSLVDVGGEPLALLRLAVPGACSTVVTTRYLTNTMLAMASYVADHTPPLIVELYGNSMSEVGNLYKATRKTAEAVGFHSNGAQADSCGPGSRLTCGRSRTVAWSAES